MKPPLLSKSFRNASQVVYQKKGQKNFRKNLPKCVTNGKEIFIRYQHGIGLHGRKLPGKAKTALAQIIDDEINLSVINKIELQGFIKVEQDLIDFVNCSNICMMDDDIVKKTIEVRRLYKIKLPDAVIAATALQYSFVLVTNNIKDFKGIKGVEVVNPHDL
jgi:hypothetical protein